VIRPLLLAALLVVGCATAAGPVRDTTGEPPAGSAATDFTLRDAETGRDVRLSDYAGRVVLIDFWATWCQPCVAAIPHLQEMYTRLKDAGFVVLGVSMDGPESVATVAPFMRSLGVTFPVLLDEETRVVSIYNPKRSAPMQVLVDRQGRIAQMRQGYSAGDETLIEAEVTRLLGQK
jgi:peroxiredoxin